MSKKPGLAIAIIDSAKKGKSDMPADTSGEEDNEKKIAASDVLDAIKNEDVTALMDALEAFFVACDTSPHEEYQGGA